MVGKHYVVNVTNSAKNDINSKKAGMIEREVSFTDNAKVKDTSVKKGGNASKSDHAIEVKPHTEKQQRNNGKGSIEQTLLKPLFCSILILVIVLTMCVTVIVLYSTFLKITSDKSFEAGNASGKMFDKIMKILEEKSKDDSNMMNLINKNSDVLEMIGEKLDLSLNNEDEIDRKLKVIAVAEGISLTGKQTAEEPDNIEDYDEMKENIEVNNDFDGNFEDSITNQATENSDNVEGSPFIQEQDDDAYDFSDENKIVLDQASVS